MLSCNNSSLLLPIGTPLADRRIFSRSDQAVWRPIRPVVSHANRKCLPYRIKIDITFKGTLLFNGEQMLSAGGRSMAAASTEAGRFTGQATKIRGWNSNFMEAGGGRCRKNDCRFLRRSVRQTPMEECGQSPHLLHCGDKGPGSQAFLWPPPGVSAGKRHDIE